MAITTETPTEGSTDGRIERRYPVPTTAVELARRATVGTFVAIVAALLARAIAFAVYPDIGAGVTAPSPFAIGSIVGFTVFSGAGAAVVYAALVRLTARPVRNFAVAVAAFFVVMMGPLLTAAPAQGVTTVGLAVLFVFHVVVAGSLVAFIAGAIRP